MREAPPGARAAQVLGLLLARSPRSGEEMGARLGLSRAGVAKAVAALRAQGFAIAARPRAGYQLLGEPPEVLPARVEARLAPGSLGRPLYHHAELDSTNLEARRRAEAGAPHGACVVAEYQCAGRGRLARGWQAPPGTCLTFTLILRPAIRLERVFALTNLAALALCRTIEAHCGLAPLVKWPNDLYLGEGKLAGILTEFVGRAERVEHAVVGVGLNVNLSPGELEGLRAPIASLLAASGRVWDRAPLLAAVLEELTGLYRRFTAGDPGLAEEYQRRSLLMGRAITVRDGEEVRRGVVKGVAEDGALLLEEAPGRITAIRHGDATVLAK